MIEPPPMTRDSGREQRAAAPAPRTNDSNSDVHRVMPSFYDTRMNRMSAMAAKPTPVEPPQPEPAPQPAMVEPPRLPEGPVVARNGGVEDAAAQLLRPILRQWLTENMPKIVEKALRDETGRG
jgi:hypothetical protein